MGGNTVSLGSKFCDFEIKNYILLVFLCIATNIVPAYIFICINIYSVSITKLYLIYQSI